MGIAILNPQELIEFFLTNALQNFKETLRHPLEITATYFGQSPKQQTSSFVIDFKEFEGITRGGAEIEKQIDSSIEAAKE